MKHKSYFGTDGIRGIIGKEPLTEENIRKIAHAIGSWFIIKYGTTPLILLGSDSRASGMYIKSILIEKLSLQNILIFDGGTIPTPTLSVLLKNDCLFSGGIMISASHNPAEYNGLKIFDHTGNKLSYDDEIMIEDLIYQTSLHNAHDHHIGSHKPHLVCTYDEAKDLYLHALTSQFTTLTLKNKKIVLDCAHGAVSFLAPTLFSSFGATVIPINNAPNGSNINVDAGVLDISILKAAVEREGADIGFAFDGDGDRIVAATKTHEYTGDDIIALLSNHPAYANTKYVVGTIMSNGGLEQYCATKGKLFLRTPVGDRFVSQLMQQNQCTLGGEPSGHIILIDHAPTSDGLFTALRLMEYFCAEEQTFRTTKLFNHFPALQSSLPLPSLTSSADINRSCTQIAAVIEKSFPSCRIIVRCSGTEPVLRVMVEGPTSQIIENAHLALVQELHHTLALSTY